MNQQIATGQKKPANWWENDPIAPAETASQGAKWWEADPIAADEPPKRQAPVRTERTWGEALGDTAVQLAEGVNTIAGAVPNLVAPEGRTAEFFRDNADYWRDKQSDTLKTKIARADEAITAAGEDGVISQIAEAASQYFTDPALAARFVTTNLPSMIPGIGAAKVAQAAALARGATLMRAASIATTAAGATNAVLNAGGARGEAFEDIKRTLQSQGYSPEQAEQMALSDSRVSAAVGALTGYVSGKTGLEGSIVGKAGAGGVLKAGARAAAAELAGEQIEEVTPKLTTNVLASQYDDRSIGQDVGRTIVETAIGSGPGSIVAGGATAMNTRALAREAAGEPGAQPAPSQAQPSALPGATAPDADPTSQIDRVMAQRTAQSTAQVAPATAAEPRRQRPEARLAELDIVKIYRPLNELEVQESIALLQEIQGRETDEAATVQAAADQFPQPVDRAAVEVPAGTDPEAGAALENMTAPAAATSDQADPTAVAMKAAELRRREAPETVDPRVDPVAAQEAFLEGLARSNPDQAQAIAQAFRANPQQFSDITGTSPDRIGAYASIIERRLALGSQPSPQGEVAPQAPTNFWAYAKERGYTPGQVKKGTQLWTILKADYEQAKANAKRASNPASILPAPSMQTQASIAPAAQPINPTINQGPAQALDQVAPVTPATGIDPALQNRDRSRAASVAQMADIARNPDYMRLATSRTPDAGAPMVFAVGDDIAKIPEGNSGRADVAVMADGQRVPFRYAVVDARTVEPSNFADGRVNGAYTVNMPGTLKALNNGRTAGLRAAYEQGTAGNYQAELIADADAHGVPVEAIQRTPNPILVRVYSDRSNTPDMAAKSQGQGLGMSPTELARQDAPLIDSSVLTAYQPGDVTSAANRDFVRAFVGKLNQSGQDVAGMMTADGSLSPAGRQRIQAALMQAAYGDADLVVELFDSLDTDIKAIGEALKTVAAEWASMRDSARQGLINPDADITDNLVQAVNLVRKARRDNASLYDLVNQTDLMTGEVPDPLTVGALRFFYPSQYMTRAAGREAIVSALRDYTRAAMGTTAGADMFGQVVTPSDILNGITDQGATNAQDPTQEGSRGTDGRGIDGGRADATGQGTEPVGNDRAGREAGADRQGERENPAGQVRPSRAQAPEGDEAQGLSALTQEEVLARMGQSLLGAEPTNAERLAVGSMLQKGAVVSSAGMSSGITGRVARINLSDQYQTARYFVHLHWHDNGKPRKINSSGGSSYHTDFFVRDGKLYSEESFGDRALKQEWSIVSAEQQSAPASGIDREKLDKDFRIFPTQILNNLLERGEAAKLYQAAGVKGANAFGGLAMDDKAAAYVKFVERGGNPVDNLPKDYNAWAASQEREAEVRRLQSDKVVRQASGKPFKTKTAAQQFQERYDLAGTHEVVEAEGGFVLRQLSPAAQADLKRRADGRESYTDAQAAVAQEMGIGTNADGEWDATDAQFDELERRTQARMRGKPQATEARIQDVGEQLYANRRNFTGRGLKWEDVEGLNDTLKVKEVTKAKVWPRPNYEQLVADGMPPVLARMVKHVYDGLSAGPTIKTGTPPTDADLKRYIDTLAKVREGLFGFVNDRQLVADFAKGVLTMVKGEATALGPISILDMAKQSMDAREISTVLLRRVWPEQFAANVPTMGRFTRGSEAQKDVSIIGGNKAIGALQFDRNDISKWVGDLGKGWPAKREAWQVQGYRVLAPGEYTAAGQEQADGTTRMSIRPKQGRGSWRAVFTDEQLANPPFMLVQDGGFSGEAFATREDAIEAAREKVKRSPGAGQDIRGTNIEEAERTGPARRQDGEDITPQRLMDAFGFRGVNFGREGWIKQAERQEYLNQAYDGLVDLAEILGVPPKAMSLEGKLGIAFGAQGKGGAHAAHFVPGYNEINLTKTKGAGTLAHEWGHAIDHHFATLAALEKDKEPFLSEHANQPDTRDRMVFDGGKYVRQNLQTFGDGIRPEIVQAFRAIYQAMEKRNESPGEMATRRESAKASALKRLDGWIKAARRVIEESAADNKADLLAEFDQHAEKFRQGDTGDGYEKAGKQVFSARVAAVRNLIKDATGRLWSADETNGLEQNASYVKSLLGKQDADTSHEPQKVATQYKADSAAMDREKGGKAYWSTPTEMFARAFELYVHDKLSQRQQRNTFLTDAELRASKPVQIADESSAMARGAGAVRDLYLYPVGKERETLREAFDNLVGQIKTKETDRGLTLYEPQGFAYTGDSYGSTDSRRGADQPAGSARAGSAAADSVRGDRGAVPGRARITALGIAADIERAGSAALIGRTVSTADELAELAQVYRDPRYETFRVFFTRSNRILHATGVSARLPGQAPMVPAGMTDAEYIQAFKDQMDTTGADGYYILHNHPSGDPTPSRSDQNVTEFLAAQVPGLQAHVVINSNRYAVIRPGEAVEVKDKDFGTDLLRIPSRPSPILNASIGSPDDLVTLGKSLQKPGWLTLIGTDSGNRVRLTADIPASALSREPRVLAGQVRRLMRQSGSRNMHLIGSDADVASAPVQQALREGILRDAVGTTGRTQAERGVGANGEGFSRTKGRMVAEGEIRPESAAFKRWFGDSKVVDANGKPLVVYHGTMAIGDFSSFGPVNFFTPDPAYADIFNGGGGLDRGRTMPVYLSLKNPLDARELGAKPQTTQAVLDFLDGAGVLSKRAKGLEDSIRNFGRAEWWYHFRNNPELLDAIKAAGYDGLIQQESVGEKTADAYVAFEPTQIKSAIGNRGTFDPNDPSIVREDEPGYRGVYSTTGRSIPLTAGQRVVESAVADEIEQRIGQFAHQPTIVVRDSAEGILPGATKADGVAGAVHEGRIFLFLDQMATRADVQETLFHELFHYGVRRIFTRDQFIQEMRTLYDRDAWVKARADAWVKTPEGKAAALYGGDEYALARGVDETLARLAEPNAGAYTRTDAFSRAIVNITSWMADLAQRLGFTNYAAKLRGIKNQEARELIQRVFRTLETQANPERAGWMDDAEPAFSRNSIGGNEPPQIQPEQGNAWTRAKAKAMQLTSPTAIDRLIYEFQDKYIDLKNLRDHIKAIGGNITDLNDAYLGEELYHKRLAKRTADFLDKELKPLLADMRSRSVSLPELERYLHARHAPEANKALAERNPNRAMIDAGKEQANRRVKDLQLQYQRAKAQGSATKAIEDALNTARDEAATWNGAQAFRGTEEERLSLSGMSDAEAKAYMDSLTPRQRDNFKELADRVDLIQSKTLDTLVDYGLMDRPTITGWRSQYQFYVPLHRDEAHAESDRHPIGQGFSVKGTGMKSRVGSNEKVTNILAHIAMQRETALTRGEKNHVVKKLYLMAAQNPDEEFWEIDRPAQIKTIDPRNGFVRTMVDPRFKHLPNVVMVRIAGRDQAIVFNEHNPQAVRLAEAMKNLDVGDLHVVLGLAAKGTRWFASVNTQYNPIFGLINFARDVQAGLLNLSTTELAGKQKEVASKVFTAMRAIYRERRGKTGSNAQWARLWDEFQDVGGTTGYRDLFTDANDRANKLAKELNALDRGQVSKAAHAVVDWLSDYNETMENAVRLAAYKVALDQGMTKERAASLAKNITVNFNRKGRQAREIGALYAFFNASLQGTARMVETLRGPVGKRIMYGGVLLGVVNTLIGMAMMGADDDDEADNWEQIPEFIKERSIIIPLGREDYVTIPMPLGFHVFPNIGRIATEYALGESDKSLGRQIGKLLLAITDAFNPLGGSQNLGQLVAPTVIDPVVALMQNRDWTGKPIYRENANGLDPQPGHRMVKDSASTPSRAVSEAINKITGGTDYRPGAWSPTPDQLDYVIGQLTGGLGRELLKVNQTIASTVTGDELPPYKVPLVGRLYGNTRGPAGQSEQFYENVKLLNEIENEYKGRLRNREDVNELLENEPLVKLIGLGNGTENQVRKLRAMRRSLVERKDQGYQERAKEIDERIGEAMARLNTEVAKARREAAR